MTLAYCEVPAVRLLHRALLLMYMCHRQATCSGMPCSGRKDSSVAFETLAAQRARSAEEGASRSGRCWR